MDQDRLSPSETPSVELIEANVEGTRSPESGEAGRPPDTGVTSVRLWHPPPRAVGELLRLEGYYKNLVKSFVFIQNTKESSDKLVETMVNIIGAAAHFKFVQTHSIGLNSILRMMRKVEASRVPQVFVVDATGMKGDINQFCESLALLEHRQCGVWLRGYVRHLDPRVISLFDALFVFDMSFMEYEVLRSAISLPTGITGEMRGKLDDKDRVLFFVNYRRSVEAPLIEKNPLVLSQIEEAPMDITPLIPIITEATKFLFDEASQWLEIVRKRTGSKVNASESEEDAGLPVLDRQQFSSLADDFKALRATIDRVAVESSAYRIQGLVEQIQIHYKNLTDLENTEAEFGPLTPQHIKRAIERESQAVLSKTQELQKLLSSVYQKRLQV